MMIEGPKRLRGVDAPYDLMGIYRLICSDIPKAYLKSVTTEDSAAKRKIEAFFAVGSESLPLLDVSKLAEAERVKVRKFGGSVLHIQQKDSDDGLLAFVGELYYVVVTNDTLVPEATALHLAQKLETLTGKKPYVEREQVRK